uniref:BTB domain-containing protein n=1 Tax=Panagrolaimus sp. ES5 TaxID=591445 RepID=A0AC34F7X7_9BILA
MSSAATTDLVYPISINWTFEDGFFEIFSGKERLKTQYFHLPGFPVTYYLTINYHQNYDGLPGVEIMLNCFCDYDNVEIEADFTYLFYGSDIIVQDPKQIKFLFDDDNNEVECFAEIEWEDSDADDICIIVSGTFTIKEIPSIPLSIKVPKSNKEMFSDNDGKNFTIVAEEQEIKVHKSILEQVSPVFCRMLESKWKESVEGKIEFSFLSFKLAKIAIDALYGQKYWRLLDKNEYLQLYQFADQYDISALK